MSLRRFVISICISAMGVAALARHAHADDAAGSLGGGGTAHGDISKTAGETDRISLDLDEGATLQLTFHAAFVASLALTDPDGTPLDLAFPGGSRLRTNLPVQKTGTYELAIASTDGSQGLYTVIAKQKWARALAIQGTGEQIVGVPMPANSRLGCVVGASQGASGLPQVAQLEDPDGASILAAAIEPRGRVARLAPTATAAAGVYHLTIAPTDGSSGWSGRVTRFVPRVAPTSLRITNGLDKISFRADGVGSFFAHRCASCHGWAASYGGVRRYARVALGRMAGGSMPPGGGLAPSDLGLVKGWISTGMKP